MNSLLLVAGAIGIFHTLGHAIGGHKQHYVDYLKIEYPTHDLKKTLQIIWHTVTLDRLVGGVFLLYVGFTGIDPGIFLIYLIFHDTLIAGVHLWSTFDSKLENRGFHFLPFTTHALIGVLCLVALLQSS